jgi:hypothetical protein
VSTVTRIIREAEAASARDAMRLLREEDLRAAMRAAARQADLRREPVHQKPVRQEPGPCSRPDPHVAGVPITNNAPGRPEVRVVGRSPQPAKPIRSAKSAIVPEPDQVRSEPASRRSTPLEPPGY